MTYGWRWGRCPRAKRTENARGTRRQGRAARTILPVTLLAAALAGCTPAQTVQTQAGHTQTVQTQAASVRPADAPARAAAPLDLSGPPPDVVLLAVSGHCPPRPVCVAAYDNHDYLSELGTLEHLAAALAGQGLSVQVAGYASGGVQRTRAGGMSPRRTWPHLRADYAELVRRWPEAPPHVILLGHSHGVAWLHTLAAQFPQRRVDVLVDLDAICAMWLVDYGPSLWALPTQVAGQPPIGEACTPTLIDGLWYRGKDIVPDNVTLNLEVQSGRPLRAPTLRDANYLWELTPNVRPDGSRTGILSVVSERENHERVSQPDSDALGWVTAQVVQAARHWHRQD